MIKLTTSILGLATLTAIAELRLPSIFSENMVLQRETPVAIWGKAKANEKIIVTFGKQKKSTISDKQGKWNIKLQPLKASKKPASLHISTASGKQKCFNNILVGEVWLASGQSNMEWSPKYSRKEDLQAVRKQTLPQIRLFAIPRKVSYSNQEDVNAKWAISTPEAASNFSAVAWFFAKHLHDELDVPVGIIRSAWGGSKIEPWITDEGYQSVNTLKKLYEGRLAKTPGKAAYLKAHKNYLNKLHKWHKQAQQALTKNQAFPPAPKQPATLSKGKQSYGLYQGMVHPIVPFSIKGFIWYQGESNNGDGMLYLEKKKALINGWRKAFANKKAPFYFVQIAPFNYGRRGNLPQLQFAQQHCITSIPYTGMVVSNDVGNIRDIHPRNKSTIGKRLAQWALAKNYGKKTPYSGPLYKGFTVKGNQIKINFLHSKGLKTRDGKPATHFEIADDSNKWVPAKVTIKNDSLLLSSPKLAKPTRARFAWNQLAEPNLCNVANLPAGCFHTHWPTKPTK